MDDGFSNAVNVRIYLSREQIKNSVIINWWHENLLKTF